MSKNIFILGGGTTGEHCDTWYGEPISSEEFYPKTTTEIDRMIVHATQKDNPKVLFITTASETGKANTSMLKEALTEQYQELGARVSFLENLQNLSSLSENIKNKIITADAIYVTGGNTYQLMETFQKLGIASLLEKAFNQRTVMSGMSAGSICWFNYGCSNSFYTGKPFKVPAMNWIPLAICPHYDSEEFRQEPFKEMLKEAPEIVGLALDEQAALEIKDNNYKVHIMQPGAKIQKCYWQGNKYYQEELLNDKIYSKNQILNK